MEQQKPETDRKQMPAVRLYQTKTAKGNAQSEAGKQWR